MRKKVSEEREKREKGKEHTEENFKRTLAKKNLSLGNFMGSKDYHDSP